jgi:glycosyltransferase involved in cell wall biosynthesis
MPARRLLVFSYYYPPNPSIGGARWAAMRRWLERAGHEVIVITSKANGVPSQADPGVLRTFDLAAVQGVRGLLGRSSLAPSGIPPTVQKLPPWWFTDVLVPDEFLWTWGLSALARARRLLRERRIDCVITSGPPHSTHLLPLMMGRLRPPWIVDLRDGWRFEPHRPPWPTRAQTHLDAAIERWAMRSSGVAIGATPPIAEDAAARLGVLAAHVPNGWDPELSPQFVGVAPVDHRFVNVVYTGKLSGTRGRDPKPFFAALRRLSVQRPAIAARLRLVVAGPLDTRDERLLREANLGDAVVYAGSLGRNAALELQRSADALLLLTVPGQVSEATGKLFEYLMAGRPIIVLARDTEAARIVQETGTGVAIAPEDGDGIVSALEHVVDGTLAAGYAPRGLDRYIYPGPAEEVAQLVERVLRRASEHAQRAGGLRQRPASVGGTE